MSRLLLNFVQHQPRERVLLFFGHLLKLFDRFLEGVGHAIKYSMGDHSRKVIPEVPYTKPPARVPCDLLYPLQIRFRAATRMRSE